MEEKRYRILGVMALCRVDERFKTLGEAIAYYSSLTVKTARQCRFYLEVKESEKIEGHHNVEQMFSHRGDADYNVEPSAVSTARYLITTERLVKVYDNFMVDKDTLDKRGISIDNEGEVLEYLENNNSTFDHRSDTQDEDYVANSHKIVEKELEED